MLTPGELLTVGECQDSHSLRTLAVRHMLQRPTGCDAFSQKTSAVINEQLHDGDGGSMQIRQMARGCSERYRRRGAEIKVARINARDDERLVGT